MFFGASILEGFWEGFGRVLGGQNPRFSHFFRCFFDVNFEARFEEAKNHKKTRQEDRMRTDGAGAPVHGTLLGRTKEGLKDLSLGVLNLDAELSAKILANMQTVHSLIQHALHPPEVGRRIEEVI